MTMCDAGRQGTEGGGGTSGARKAPRLGPSSPPRIFSPFATVKTFYKTYSRQKGPLPFLYFFRFFSGVWAVLRIDLGKLEVNRAIKLAFSRERSTGPAFCWGV